MSSERQERQVFICHAGGDKETVARPMATALSNLGVSVWLDADQLRIGDRLRPAVDSALSRCSSAVVIFSPAFYLSHWAAEYEFDRIIARFVAAELLLLPILHNIDRAEFHLREPSLGSCISRSTSEFVISDIAKEIAEVVIDSAPRSCG
jgi:TIR domain